MSMLEEILNCAQVVWYSQMINENTRRKIRKVWAKDSKKSREEFSFIFYSIETYLEQLLREWIVLNIRIWKILRYARNIFVKV